jgi:hypothetical protein
MSPEPTKNSATRLWPVAIFTLLYLLAAIGGAYTRGNREFVFYIAVMLVLIAAVGWLHRQVQLSAGILWALSIWGALHMAGGLVPVPASWPIDGDQRVLYSLWLIPDRLKYDQVVHAYGFGITTWTCWHALRAAMAHRLSVAPQQIQPTFGLLLLCLAAGMGFGALNEVIEFVAVLTVPNTNVGGYENTGWDLVSNLTGCLIAALAIYVGTRTQPRVR